MIQKPARTSLGIRFSTAAAILVDAGLFVAARFVPSMLVIAIILAAAIAGCYLAWTPVRYELEGKELRVGFRIGSVRYGPVISCSRPSAPIRGAIGLCRNGGVFSVSGIFWSKAL